MIIIIIFLLVILRRPCYNSGAPLCGALPACLLRLRGRFFVYVDIIHQIHLVVNREIQIYLVSFRVGSLIFTVFYTRT
nr:MAG TPA: hypothetical protein [Caudoviricetes sp.]